MPGVQRIGSAHDLRSCLEDVLDKTKNKTESDEETSAFRTKIKTYLIESNNPDTNCLNQNKVEIKDTFDTTLKILKANVKGKDYELYLDSAEDRFWKIYSLHDSKVTESIINRLVLKNNNKLDFVWFPSSLLERYMGLGAETGFSLKYRNKFNTENSDKKINVSMRFWVVNC